MSKRFYYNCFADVREYIKFNPILKELHISQSNFSKFMTGKREYEIFMSESNLRLIYNAIYNLCLSFCDIHNDKIA